MSVSRFLQAQNFNNAYERAMDELGEGKKRTHWMWFIFPQLQGLGKSSYSEFYGIRGLTEAKAYAMNPILMTRLRNAAYILLSLPECQIGDVMGRDAQKLRSSMTLFDAVCPDNVFKDVLDRYFQGERCETTLKMIQD